VVVEIARRRWASWGDSAAAELVGRPAASPNTPSNPTARPYTENLTGRADALNRLPETAWTPAYDGDGEPHDGADVADDRAAEPDRMASAHPRHRPPRSAAPRRAAAAGRPGRAADHLLPTHTSGGQLPDRNCGTAAAPAPKTASAAPKTLAWPTCRFTTRHLTRSGWPSFSSPTTLLTWTLTPLSGPLRVAEPRPLRLRLLAIAGRMTRSGRRTQLRLDRRWPWAATVTAAVARCAPSPTPADNTAPDPTTRDNAPARQPAIITPRTRHR
jgi:hypothetical protein